MTSNGYFITGTDTEIGKTRITLALMSLFQAKGMTASGMKPVASGCEDTAEGLRNEDALQIMQQAGRQTDYEIINPYAFAPPVAPHIAADRVGITIDIDKIADAYRSLHSNSDVVVVEGIGGWRVPLGNGLSLGDLVVSLRLPVILVVGLRLGCINHALLTAEAIRADGLKMVGWIANQIDKNYDSIEESIDGLDKRLGSPLLGTVPYMRSINTEQIGEEIDMDLLLEQG